MDELIKEFKNRVINEKPKNKDSFINSFMKEKDSTSFHIRLMLESVYDAVKKSESIGGKHNGSI